MMVCLSLKVAIPICLAGIFVLLQHTYQWFGSQVESSVAIPVCMCVTNWNQYRKHLFTNCLDSLFTSTDHQISLHLIVDETSSAEAKKAVLNSGHVHQLKSVELYFIESIYGLFRQDIKLMLKYFGNDIRPYYQKPVFYMAPIIHSIISEDKLIMLDIDTKVLGDLYDLYSEFQLFTAEQYWGSAYEQGPYYMVVLNEYRTAHPRTRLGSPPRQLGHPGLNTGVLLVYTSRLRQRSSAINGYLSARNYEFLVNRFMVRDNLVLGGQDFLTLMSFEHPEMFRVLSCSWNRQLCMWFKENGFSDVFDSYHECRHKAKILHGNCNTTIP